MMNNFNRGGGFQGRGQSRGFGGKSFGRPPMHQAVCSSCGHECEVPFRPAPGKPVFCNDCFRNEEKSERPGKRDFGRHGFREKPMFEATCAECGERCEVPFKPTGEKPIYCKECFGASKGEPSFRPAKPDQSGEFAKLNAKLDKILKELEMLRGKKTFVVEKQEEEVKAPKTEAPKAEKKAKKTADKKAPKAPAKGKKKGKK